MSNTVLLSPSEDFLARLPNQRIPDRQDFKHYAGQDDERIKVWRQAMEESRRLGDEFLEAVTTGSIREQVKLIA